MKPKETGAREALAICREENRRIKKTIGKFRKVIHKCRRDSIAADFPALFESLQTLETHFAIQKEDLFPLISGMPLTPSLLELEVTQERVKKSLNAVLAAYERGHTEELCTFADDLVAEIKTITHIEETLLFPAIQESISRT